MSAAPAKTAKPVWTATRIVIALALAKLLLHLLTYRGYGIFRDELYYLACSRHLDWGYIEFPPMIAVLTRAVTAVLGDGLFAIRLLPAVAGAGLVVLVAMIARELGGGRFAQGLASLSVICAPEWLGNNHILNTNAFEPLFWAGCAWLAIRAIKTGNSRYWLWFGFLAGLGLMNKHSMLFFGIAVTVGLLLTPARRAFTQRNFWIGGAIAALIFLPNVLWEIRWGWPTLEFLHNAVKYKNAILTPWEFIGSQLLLTGAAIAVWLNGLWFYFSKRGRAYRALGWAYLIVALLIFVLHGKGYYVVPAYPMLLGAGGVMLEERIARRGWNWLRPALVTVMLVPTAILLPLAIPVLPVTTFIRYSAWLGFHYEEERHQMGALPQFYADMFGWRNMANQVAAVFRTLTAEEQAHTSIYGRNYGDAAAIDYFGPKLGLPHAISGHNNYYLWGPPPPGLQVLITIGGNPDTWRKIFGDVRAAGQIVSPYAMPYETNVTIWVCRQPKIPLGNIWPKFKSYI